MGAFFKAFWSRMGRNAGNRVSNALFGDKWSTPYRVGVSNKGNSNSSGRGGNRRQNPRNAEVGHSQPSRRGSARSSSNSNWLYWVGGLILFCGTYNAIINPNYEEIVLLIMLWIVAVVVYLVKRK